MELFLICIRNLLGFQNQSAGSAISTWLTVGFSIVFSGKCPNPILQTYLPVWYNVVEIA